MRKSIIVLLAKNMCETWTDIHVYAICIVTDMLQYIADLQNFLNLYFSSSCRIHNNNWFGFKRSHSKGSLRSALTAFIDYFKSS